MGIPGLTTYISQNSNHFYQPLKLHDCTLVVDGCSLACQLYIQASNCKRAFGGDYDRFAEALEHFFALLKQCNVTPVVVIDGGYEARKLKTVLQRLKEKMNLSSRCNPVNQSGICIFPLFLMEVFKQTLISQQIKFVQADFEADYEIAAIARHLSSPVLSNDSDFYVYNVLYIPFSTLSLVPLKIQKESCTGYYLGCEVFKIELFISKFGGLDKSLLPLVAVLLGNDYIPSSIFSTFVSSRVASLTNKKMSQHQMKITAIFQWLKNETLESATIKLLNHLKRKDRSRVKHQIELCVSSYSLHSSDLLTFLGLHASNSGSFVPDETHLHHSNHDDPNIDYDSSAESLSSNGSGYESVGDVDEFEFHELHSPSEGFPLWLKDKYRRGEVPSFIADIWHLQVYICQPQVEDFTYSDSNSISFPILQVICGLLQGDFQEQTTESDSYNIYCYSRGATSKCQIIELKPTRSLPSLPCFPPISTLPNLPLSERKNIFYSTLGITDVKEIATLESFGGKWNLFASAVVFWARSTAAPNVTFCHLQAIIICMISLGVVDEKLGRIRLEKEITKRKLQNPHKKNAVKLNETSSNDLVMNSQNSVETLDNQLSRVSEVECLSSAEFFLQFHNVGGRLKVSPREFSRSIVHSFAQLQACLLQAMSLNSLLEFAVPQCQVSETFSGSVAYITFVNFDKRKDLEAYVSAALSSSPSVFAVYKALQDRFLSLLPNVLSLLCEDSKKSKSKRKSKKKGRSSQAEEQVVSDESTLGVANKFAVLSGL